MQETRHAVLATDLGDLTAVRDGRGLRGLYFPGHWTKPDQAQWGPLVDAREPGFAEVAEQLDHYLCGVRQDFDLDLHLVGSERAQAVWRLLRAVPYGETTTYGALAEQIGGTHARAVGHFVGHNPVSVVVPCHRVLGASGDLTGYAGGLERKRRLLALEGALAQDGLW